ncbi:hypothetical protein ID0158_06800 [Helicobacter pylori]
MICFANKKTAIKNLKMLKAFFIIKIKESLRKASDNPLKRSWGVRGILKGVKEGELSAKYPPIPLRE